MTELKLSSTQAHRFWSLVDASMPDACWPWLGAILQRGGYGHENVNTCSLLFISLRSNILLFVSQTVDFLLRLTYFLFPMYYIV